MSGAIMPEPLQKPLSVTVTPSMTAVRVESFGNVSVVRIASAAPRQAALSAAADAAVEGSALTILSAGGGSPITPVEATNTSFVSHFAIFAIAATVRRTTSTPALPVKVLELPEFTTMARACGRYMPAVYDSTGAPQVLDLVNTPAIVVPESSSATMRSRRSL